MAGHGAVTDGPQRGDLPPAALPGIGATGVEGAAGRRVDRARDLAREQHDLFIARVRVALGDRTE